MTTQRKRPPYEDLTSRWGGMKLRYELGSRIEGWLSAFRAEEQPLLLDLLSKFYYYSEDRIKDKVKELYSKFCNQYDQDAGNAIYIKMFKEQGVGYSNIVFNSFWIENNLSDFAEENIAGLLCEDQIPPVVVIVDDFSGTGKTFIKTVNQLVKINAEVAESKFYFLVLHITEVAKNCIEEYIKEIGIYIRIVSIDETKEAFTEGYLYEQVQAIQYRLGYESICARLNTKGDYIFGFENVESLVAFHYNTPNNTLGLFWQDLMNFYALFPRHKRARTSLRQMQLEASQRRKRRENIVFFGLEDNRKAAFMVYCIAEGCGFSQEKAMRDFGFTLEQVGGIIREMIDDKYVIYSGGKFFATAKLRSQLFTSRLKTLKKTYDKCDSPVARSFNLHNEYVPINFK